MATMNLGTLFVQLNAESKGFSSGMAKAAEGVEKFAKTTKKLANEVAGASGMMLALGAAAVKLASSVDARAAASMARLEKSTKLLAVQVADMLLPAVEQLSKWFRQAADWVAGLDPAIKSQISTWAIWAAGIAVAGKALGVILGLVDEVAGSLGTLFKAIGSVGIVPLLEVIAVLAIVVGTVIFLHRAWRKNWMNIQEVTQSVVAGISDAFTSLWGFFKGFWDAQIDYAHGFVDAILSAVDAVQKLTGRKSGDFGFIDTGFLKGGFDSLFADLKSGDFIAQGIKFGKQVGQDIADAATEELPLIIKEVRAALGISGGSLSSGGKARQPSGPFKGYGDVTGKAEHSMAGMARSFLKDVSEQNAIIEWADASLREMDLADKKLAKERAKEIETRRQLREDLDAARRLSKAQVTGDTSGLNDSERAKAEQDTGGSWSELNKAQQNLGNFMDRMGPSMLSAMGKVGSSISSIMEGAKAGGVWGAVIAALLEVFKTMESFNVLLERLAYAFTRVGEFLGPVLDGLFKFVGDVVAIIIEAVGPILSALKPMFDGLNPLLQGLMPVLGIFAMFIGMLAPVIEGVAKVLGAILKALTPVMRFLYEIARAIFVGLGGILFGVLHVWNVVLDAIAGIVEMVLNVITLGTQQAWAKEVADGIRGGKADTTKLGKDIDAMSVATYDQMMATTANTVATYDAAAANAAAASTADKLAESLTNVPSGYRIAYQQAAAQSPAGYDAAMGGSEGGFMIGTLNLNATEGVDRESIIALMQRLRAQKRGNYAAQEP